MDNKMELDMLNLLGYILSDDDVNDDTTKVINITALAFQITENLKKDNNNGS